MIINAGSENKGGTFKQAQINAQEWLELIHDDGFPEVEMKYIKRYDDGDWLFYFIHPVTNKVATLEIHGFTEEECNQFMFHPRVYWNGSSTANPRIEDWLEEGFKFKVQYYQE